MRLLIIVVLAVCASAAEGTLTLPLDGTLQRQSIPAGACAAGGSFDLSWDCGGSEEPAQARWLDLALETSDGRWFSCAAPLRLRPGTSGARSLVLDASAWSSRAGILGGDALAGVTAVQVRSHGPILAGADLRLRWRIVPATHAPAFVVEQVGGGLVRRVAADGRERWVEWRLRLLGDVRGETGSLDAVTTDGHRLPAFLEQPGTVAATWMARGPARWVFRLREGEAGTAIRLAWRGTAGNRWESAAMTIPTAITAEESLPGEPAIGWALPRSAAWEGPAARRRNGGFERIDHGGEPEALAPILRWRADWTGFRGPRLTSHLQALRLDAALAADQVAIDLLPQALAEEQGAFRFGLAPWQAQVGGSVVYVQDLWAQDEPAAGWVAQAREIVARCRAAGVRSWSCGLTAPANDAAQVARLQATASAIADLVDDDEILVRHPQVVAYPYRADDRPWSDFEGGTEGWAAAKLPGLAAPRSSAGGSSGSRCLELPLADLGPVRVAACERLIEANVTNLDRLEFDLRVEGGSGVAAQVFCWVTDRHHRWYQIPVARLQASPRWTTVGVDLDGETPWQAVGHTAAWDGDQRRQVRRLGVAVFVHGDAEAKARVHLDRIVRRGWPDAAVPALEIRDLRVAAVPVARSTPLAVDFGLSVLARNPYDPDLADVVADLVAPDGTTRTYPCYWSEPMRLDFTKGLESVVPDGAGAWHLRFSPPVSGTWRWRIRARITWRDRVLEATGSWNELSVPDAWPDLVPVRPDPADPTWWKRDDGTFWYPLGINLRSPGDTRQDKILIAHAAGKALARRDADPLRDPLPGWTSPQWDRLGTVAFDRWLRKCRENGINWVRVWMCPWWCGLEWNREWDEFGGLNVYNQHAAARLDRVMDLAAREGVYVQLELQNHGMTSEHVDAQWGPDGRGNPGSPYSTRNGGMCRSAGEFFRREDAWKIHEKRLRYTLARWGHHRHLAAWVLSSEMEFTGDWNESGAFRDPYNGHAAATQRWVERSLAVVQDLDPLKRAVSIHFSHPWRGAKLWELPSLGFSNSNAYTGFQDANMGLGGRGAGLDRALAIYLDEHFPPQRLKRPTLIGEWGGHWDRNSSERLLAELHTGLWMQAVLPYGGNTGYWWWLFLDASDTWDEYAGIARFTQGWDPRRRPWTTLRIKASLGEVKTLGMGTTDEIRCYVWREGLDQSLALPGFDDAGTLRLPTGAPGSRWTWERWNTWTGAAVHHGAAAADDRGHVTLALGAMDRDAAFILRRLP